MLRKTEASGLPAMWPADNLDEAPGDRTRLKNMQQLIQLRWLAVFGQIVTIEVAHYGFRIPMPLEPMLIVLAALIGFNVASLLRWRTGREATNTELFVAMLVDVAMLTAQLYLSGGATNPFASLYLLQVILGAVLLQAWSSATLVAITGVCLVGLALFSRPLALPLDLDRGLASPYIQGMVLCFALNASLLLIFITRINANLRARDARLASLRQRAAEEEHIVRMGLLASGAAHELGTPLATLSVILGDWKRMPEFTSNPELLQEVDEMQAQLKRCKTIVSGILLSAGEARGESSAATTVVSFLDELVREWRDSRPVSATTFVYENRFGHDLPMVSDSALKQTIHNVLDNALEASPHRVKLDVERFDDRLVLTVTDAGPGFAPHMLTQLGKPYQSSKGRPGGGLGLFLVGQCAAHARRQRSTAHNLAEGGALVRISLPLSAVILEEEEPNAS
jgi:two-component system sensor histidine kinase RegB